MKLIVKKKWKIKMSKLNKLLQGLCSDGIPFQKISECCVLEKGKTPIQKAIPGKYPLVVTTSERKTSNTFQFDRPSVCIPLVSSRGHGVASLNEIFYQEGQFALGNILCAVTPIDPTILSAKFLHIYLNYAKNTLLVSQMKGGANVSLTIDAIGRCKIPVPPLEIQREIVRILDSFTSLTVELSAELSARQKQYGFYREKLLLKHSSSKHVKILDMLSQPITDGPHTTPTFVSDGIPFISVDAIWDGKIHFEKMRGYITPEFDKECSKKYKPKKNDVYMVKSGSTTGKVAFVDTDRDFNIWSPLAAMRVNSNYLSRYLFHLLQTDFIQNQIKAKSSHGSQPNLSMRVLEQIEVDVPPLDVQQRIVNVLDNFDAICSDLNIGLPAEISARQKQYEYYRDLLLSFKSIDNITDRQTDRQSIIKLLQYVFGYAKVKLEDVCNSISSGNARTKENEGKYPVYGSTGVIARADNARYNKDNILVARVGANAGYINIATGKYDVSDNTLIVDVKEEYCMKYIYYVLVNSKLNQYAKGGGQPLITAGQIKKIEIIIPDYSEQIRISEILDRFQKICMDIEKGLPAEIGKRQKQYEYYRDKLLSFKEL